MFHRSGRAHRVQYDYRPLDDQYMADVDAAFESPQSLVAEATARSERLVPAIRAKWEASFTRDKYAPRYPRQYDTSIQKYTYQEQFDQIARFLQ